MLRKKTNLLLLILVFTGFLFYYYPGILTSPNNYLFNAEADGFKNYYTYVYHVKHDSSFFQFGGMHYPYGENVVFTDGHPLLAWTLKLIAKIYPGIANYSAGIINWLMIISLLLSAIFIYLILTEYGIGPNYSALCAFAIASLSPQLLRLPGHYALAYSFVIPLTWYLTLVYKKSGVKLKWALIIFLCNTTFLFTHMYLGMVCIMFLFLYWLFFHLLRIKSENKLRFRHFLYLFIQILLPVIVTQLYLFCTDYHEGRPVSPLGFFTYHATLESLFLPYYCWFEPHIHTILGVGPLPSAEGVSYIGLATMLFIICSIIYVLYLLVQYAIRKKPATLFTVWLSPLFKPLLFTGVMALLYSMAYPYRWGMEFLLDWIPTLKQFRGLGRFAWIFYYVSTIYCAYVLNALFINVANPKKILIGLALLFPALQITEAIPYHKNLSEAIQSGENYFNHNLPSGKYYKSVAEKINSENYQAIIALPFYHEGSDNFMRLHSEKAFKISQLLSYYTGMPMVNAGLGRTSIEESKRVLQMMSRGFYDKPIKRLIKNTQPFLIVYTKESLTENEMLLLNRSKLLFEENDFAVYEISFDNLFKDERPRATSQYYSVKDSLVKHHTGILVPDTISYFYFNNFDHIPSPHVYKGSGAYVNIKNGYSLLAHIDTNVLEVGREYIASFWYYNNGENKAHIFYTAQETNSHTGVGNWNFGYDVRFAETIDGDWSLAELRFKPEQNYYSYILLLTGQPQYSDTIYVDNVLIRPAGVDVYWIENDSNLYKNNHHISTKLKKD